MATQSYTIYIRYPNQVSNNKCKPKPSGETNNTKPINGGGGIIENESSGVNIPKIVGAIKNPLGALLGNIKKAVPEVAVAYLAVKAIDQLVETALPIYAGYTGDYQPSFNYANVKAVIGAVMNPIGLVGDVVTRQMEINKQNLKITQQRMLTGNSIINTYGGKASN